MAVVRRKKRQARPYKLIGVKAFIDTDSDILKWWEAQSPRQRSEGLRQMIRDHLAGDNTAPTKTDLVEAAEWIASQQKENIVTLTRQVMLLSQQVEKMARQIAEGIRVSPAADGQQMNEPSVLSADEQAARLHKVVSRKW